MSLKQQRSSHNRRRPFTAGPRRWRNRNRKRSAWHHAAWHGAELLERRDLLAFSLTPAEPIGPLGSQLYEMQGQAEIASVGESQIADLAIDGRQNVSFEITPDSQLQPMARLVNETNTTISLTTLQAGTPGDVAIYSAYISSDANYQLVVTGADGTTGSFEVKVLLNGRSEFESAVGVSNDSPRLAEHLDLRRSGVASVRFGNVQGRLEEPVETAAPAFDFEQGNVPTGWSLHTISAAGEIAVEPTDTPSGEQALQLSVANQAYEPASAPDGTVYVFYESASGRLSVDTPQPLSTIRLISESGVFTGDAAQGLGGSVFDVDNDHTIFKLGTEGFGDLDFGNVVAPGLDPRELLADLSISGSWLRGQMPTFQLVLPGTTNVAIFELPVQLMPEQLSFAYRNEGDSPDPLSDQFRSLTGGDGVAISPDGGATWTTVFTPAQAEQDWQRMTVDLAPFAQIQTDSFLVGLFQFVSEQEQEAAASEISQWYDQIEVVANPWPGGDWYQMFVKPGDNLALTVSANDGNHQALELDVRDERGALLAIDAASQTGARTVNNLRNDTDEPMTVLARVAGEPGTDYTLSAAVDAEFEFGLLENNVLTDLRAVLGHLAVGETDVYQADAGFSVRAIRPAGGDGEFDNQLTATLTALDQSDRVMSTVTLDDDRNSTRMFLPLWTETFEIDAITSEQPGEYAISAFDSRNPPAPAQISVKQTLDVLEIEFDRTLSYTDIPQVYFNGVAVDPSQISSTGGRTIDVTFNSLDEGDYQVTVDAVGPLGSQINVDNSQTITIDRVGPKVTSSSLTANTTFTTRDVEFEFQFDELLDASKITPDDVEVFSEATGVLDVSQLVVDGRNLSFRASSLAAGDYTLTLKSAADAITGLTGQLMDGEAGTLPSGDGVSGGDYVVSFSVAPDLIPVTFNRITSDLSAELANVRETLTSADDMIEYLLPMERPQQLSLDLNADVDAQAVLTDMDGQPIATLEVAAGEVAESAYLQLDAGNYKIAINSPSGGLGSFDLDIRLNHTRPIETVTGGPETALAVGPYLRELPFGASMATILTAPSPTERIVLAEENFESGALSDAWTILTDPSATDDRAQLLTNIGGRDSTALVLDSPEVTVDPDNVTLRGNSALLYDPRTGNVTVVVAEDGLMSTLEITSASAILRTEVDLSHLVRPPFDVFTPSKFFTLKTDGFGTVELGPILPPDLTSEFLNADLAINGSVLPSGGLDAEIIVATQTTSIDAILSVDLNDSHAPIVEFSHIGWVPPYSGGTTSEQQPPTSDGVSASFDGGETWTTVWTPPAAPLATWSSFSVDLDPYVPEGQLLLDHLLLAFQSTNRGLVPVGGRGYDDIRVTGQQLPTPESVSLVSQEFDDGTLPAGWIASNRAADTSIEISDPLSNGDPAIVLSREPSDAPPHSLLTADVGLIYEPSTGSLSFVSTNQTQAHEIRLLSQVDLALAKLHPSALQASDTQALREIELERTDGIPQRLELGAVFPTDLTVEQVENLTVFLAANASGESLTTQVLLAERQRHFQAVVFPVSVPFDAVGLSLSLSHFALNDLRSLPSSSPNTNFGAGDGISVSADGGQTWTHVLEFPEQPDGEWQDLTVGLNQFINDADSLLISLHTLNEPDAGHAFDNIVVSGRVSDGANWFTIELDDGQLASVFVDANITNAGRHPLQLFDSEMNLIATSSSNDLVDFVDTTTDGSPENYYVRVSNPKSAPLQVVVVKDASLSSEIAVSENHLVTPSLARPVTFTAGQDETVVVTLEVISAALPETSIARINNQVLSVGVPREFPGVVPGSQNAIHLTPHEVDGKLVASIVRVAGSELSPPSAVAGTFPADSHTLLEPSYGMVVEFQTPVRRSDVSFERIRVNGQPIDDLVFLSDTRVMIPFSDRVALDYTVELDGGAFRTLSGVETEAYTAALSIDVEGPRILASSITPVVTANSSYPLQLTFDEMLENHQASVVIHTPGGPLEYLMDISEAAPHQGSVLVDLSREGVYQVTVQAYDQFGQSLDGEFDGEYPTGDGESGGVFTAEFSVDKPDELATFTQVAPFDASVYESSPINRFVTGQDQDTIRLPLLSNDGFMLTADIVDHGAAVIQILAPDQSVIQTSTIEPGQRYLSDFVSGVNGVYGIVVSGVDGSPSDVEIQLSLNRQLEREPEDETTNNEVNSAEPLHFLGPVLGASRSTIFGHLGDATDAQRPREFYDDFEVDSANDWQFNSLGDGQVGIASTNMGDRESRALVMSGTPASVATSSPATIDLPFVHVYYDPATGEISYASAIDLSTLEIKSTTGIFTGDNALGLGGTFDVDTDVKIFKLDSDGFHRSGTFGLVAQPGLDPRFVTQDLQIAGSFHERPGQIVADVVPHQNGAINEAVISGFVSTNSVLHFQYGGQDTTPFVPIPRGHHEYVHGDGISISQNGIDWYSTQWQPESFGPWQQAMVPIGQIAEELGLELPGPLEIKFQHSSAEDQVVAWDDIRVESPSDVDLYQFELQAGDEISLRAISDTNGQRPNLMLLDADQLPIAIGQDDATSDVTEIHRFANTSTEAQIYFLEVSGLNHDYNISLTRNAVMPTAPSGLNVQTATFANADGTGKLTSFPATAGDDLVVQVEVFSATIALESVPYSLRAPDGTIVASTAAGDELSYQATLNGTYDVVLDAAVDSKMSFVVRVSGNESSMSPFVIANASIADGQRINEAISQVTFELTNAIDLRSLQAGAVLIDGEPVEHLFINESPRQFTARLPKLSEGEHQISLAPNAIFDVQGRGLGSEEFTFVVDNVAPTITNTSLVPDSVVSTDVLTIDIQFSEAIDPSTIVPDAILLSNPLGRYAPDDLRYDAATQTVTATFSSYPELPRQILAISYLTTIRDLAGNELDDNPATPVRTPVTIPFDVDYESVPYEGPYVPLNTHLATHAYRTEVMREAVLVDDLERYTFNLSAGQSFFAELRQRNAADLAVSIIAPDGSTMLSTSEASLVLRTESLMVPTTGTYTIEFTSNRIQADIVELQLFLNHDDESQLGDDNGTLETAIDVGLISSDLRGPTILGTSDSGEDWYTFTVEPNQLFSIGLSHSTTVGDQFPRIALHDEEGQLIYKRATNGVALIDPIRNASAETKQYWIAVDTVRNRDYALSIVPERQIVTTHPGTAKPRLMDNVTLQGRIESDTTHQFPISVAEGQEVSIRIQTPSDPNAAPNEAANGTLRVIDADGTVIATSDAVDNEFQLAFLPASSGDLFVELSLSDSESGYDFWLTTSGSTVTSVPQVESSFPSPGETVSPTDLIQVSFDIDIFPRSIDLSRVQLDGSNAIAFQMVDEQTVEFRFAEPTISDSTSDFTLGAGAVRSFGGAVNEQFEFSFATRAPTTDVDGNGVVDPNDLDAFCSKFRAGQLPALDLNFDGKVTPDDLYVILINELNSRPGDANLDGEFDTSDFVHVFTQGKYEGDVFANYEDGDLDCDGRFTSSDFVLAMQYGTLEYKPATPVAVEQAFSAKDAFRATKFEATHDLRNIAAALVDSTYDDSAYDQSSKRKSGPT